MRGEESDGKAAGLMDWRVRMRRDELELRRIVRTLAAARGESPEAVASRERAITALARKLAAMKAFVEDCLSGRNTYEQSLMEYRMRVDFPLYSHLGSLSSITPKYADWFSSSRAPH
jgi:hypothetical protein